MVASPTCHDRDIWLCVHCRTPLSSAADSWHCDGCRRDYPILDGIPILVHEPLEYLRSELASMTRSLRDASDRRSALDKIGRDTGLTDAALERHRDVLDAEISRAHTFLDLLKPAAKMLDALPAARDHAWGARRTGWSADALLPYLLRDWTAAPELEVARTAIAGAAGNILPQRKAKTIAFAGCGAAGLLPGFTSLFDRVIGFDLSLAILTAARRLLDGNNIDLALPRILHPSRRISLHNPTPARQVELIAMDIFDPACADASIDCVVTSFLLDLLPDPRRLTNHIRRILRSDGVWINYGPSGPLKAHWRFDQHECAAFLEAAGFTVIGTKSLRSTYLDLSHRCPTWSFQSHICYLTAAQKQTRLPETAGDPPRSPISLDTVPQHFPGAHLIQRQPLEGDRRTAIFLRHERIAGRPENFEIDAGTAQLMALVDGKRTLREIAHLLGEDSPSYPVEKILEVFSYCFENSLLTRYDEHC